MDFNGQAAVQRIFPAEWERHEATVLFWPTRPEAYLYAGRNAWTEVSDCFRRIVDVACAFEPVVVFADPANAPEARSIVGNRATVVACPLNDAWARDAGPTIIHTGGGRLALDWRFTGWGGRFAPYDSDDQAAARVAAHFEIPAERIDLACEGGAIHSNGAGTILTTGVVLMDAGRNPGKSQAEVESRLSCALGAERVIWLPAGFDGDDTGGHIDVIAAFADPGTILLLDAKGDDPNRPLMEQNARFLANVAPEFELLRVPSPTMDYSAGSRLAHSYLNFYMVNGGLLLPTFGDALDDYVTGLMAEIFPQREIVPVESRPLYLGGGGIHCVTQQIPARRGV